MNLDWKTLFQIERQHGLAFYLFYPEIFKKNMLTFSKAFSSHYSHFKLAYHYGANPTPEVCRMVDEHGGFAAVSNWEEYSIAKLLGVLPNRIIFNGIFREELTINRVFADGSLVILESYNEAMTVVNIANANPKQKFHVGLRINISLPDNKPSRFGMDVDSPDFRRIWNQLEIAPNIIVEGLHCHATLPRKTVRAFTELTQSMILISWQLFPENPPAFIDIGGGFFGNMPPELSSQYDHPIPNIEDCGETIGALMTKAFEGKKFPILLIEPGLALVADAFKYVCKVLDVKEIQGRKLAIVSGSNTNFRNQISKRNLPVERIRITNHKNPMISGDIDIVSYSNTEKDILHYHYQGELQVGDYLIFSNVGGYSIFRKSCFNYTALPVLEVDVENNEILTLANKEEFSDILKRFSL